MGKHASVSVSNPCINALLKSLWHLFLDDWNVWEISPSLDLLAWWLVIRYCVELVVIDGGVISAVHRSEKHGGVFPLGSLF